MYDRDLAHIHHQGFGEFARAASPRLLDLLGAAGIGRGRLVDLGCGSGIWAAAAAGAGFEVVGIDASAPLLEIARRQAPDATFHHATLRQASLPPCDAVTAIGEVLSYRQPDERTDRLDEILARAHGALRSGGLLMFDLLVDGPESMEYLVERDGDGWSVQVDVREDRTHRLVERRITTCRRDGDEERIATETHHVRVRTVAEVESSLRVLGFGVTVDTGYRDFALPVRRRAFVAVR